MIKNLQVALSAKDCAEQLLFVANRSRPVKKV